MPLFDKNTKFDEFCKDAYNVSPSVLVPRFEELLSSSKEVFNNSEVDFFSSPGRIEIVGNHTDHNSGKVLCAAINFDTLAAVSKRDDGIIEIKSKGYPMLKVDTNKIEFLIQELGTSTALIKGVVEYFKQTNKNVGGFSAVATSTVPKGAGVSSSSSFECLVAEILNVYYNDSTLDDIYIAKASQYAEKVFFGKPCGLMDQCAIAIGGVNHIDFLSQDNPVVSNVKWDFKDLDIYVISTGGDHSDLTSEYAAIPNEMKQVAEKFGCKLLREVDLNEWENKKGEVKNQVSKRAYLRAEHFFEENIRVDNAAIAIKEGNQEKFLDMVNKSGESSRYKLQNTYSKKSKNKNIEKALDLVKNIDGVLAQRVHGGGFAGTILVFAVKDSKVHQKLIESFKEENVYKLSIRNSGSIKIDME